MNKENKKKTKHPAQKLSEIIEEKYPTDADKLRLEKVKNEILLEEHKTLFTLINKIEKEIKSVRFQCAPTDSIMRLIKGFRGEEIEIEEEKLEDITITLTAKDHASFLEDYSALGVAYIKKTQGKYVSIDPLKVSIRSAKAKDSLEDE